MFNRFSRMFLITMLLAVPMLWMSGSAEAYLQGSSGNPRLVAPGEPADFLTTANWAYTPLIRKFIDPLPGACIPTAANGLCETGYVNTDASTKFLPIAVPDITTYPGSDYYVIELVEFDESMHSDLDNTTTLRGYRQAGFGTDVSTCSDPADPSTCTTANNTLDFENNANAHYLGPVILAKRDRPVRVLFKNKLPTGTGGELFVPVDESVMGAGDYEIDYDVITKEPAGLTQGRFAQNRGELHLHGGRTPWISDGTPHQWITPEGEDPDYPQGVSVVNVPDMPDPGPGAQTYYWTNQQSARLMFYHDHAWGITRLNVYVGQAAGYGITDDTEQELLDTGILPETLIPLVVQDKSYVDATPVTDPLSGATVPAIFLTDPTWRWGTGAFNGNTFTDDFGNLVEAREPKTGDLWWPHVYMPAQNPFDITGIAPMGRWAYGPYFWPATNNPYQPVANPYYNPDCDISNPAQNESNTFGYTTINGVPFCQPFEVPSTPNPSWGAEAFMDTPTVNGTAYPVMNVEAKAYRFKILNAAHDRFFNLQMYEADPDAAANGTSAECIALGGCETLTEVKMVPAVPYPDAPDTWPTDGRDGGVPDWNLAGPNWIMYGSEGGVLPQPVEIPNNPVDWNVDVTTFNAGNVNSGSLILGPAERAEVVVDFTDYEGKTLILYNDAPAPWPALDPHYDYYTDDPDYTEIGGAPTTLAGLGPNTRTIMKIVVGATTTGGTFSLEAMKAAFDPDTPLIDGDSVFEKSQDPLIVAQGNMNPGGDPAFYEAFAFGTPPYNVDYSAINDTYDGSFPTNWPNWGVARINDKAINFFGIDPEAADYGAYQYDPADTATHEYDADYPLNGGIGLKLKAIQDEQGETFDNYGRMRAALGLERVNAGAGVVNFVVQTYSDPATEILEEEGIQVWKITHNGVDTHPVHFHLYDVQVLNRVGWDGFLRLPDPTEAGWKDTVRISPLEDTIVALKPVTPMVPFGVPESIRPLNPARAIGSNDELTQVDPVTGTARTNLNRMENLDWEYVWHCHILSHEENDMMRPQSFLFAEDLPSAPTGLAANLGDGQIDLSWTDPTPVDYILQTGFGDKDGEIGFSIERRASDEIIFTEIGKALANATSYSDTAISAGQGYSYRVRAYNAAGSSAVSNSASTGGFALIDPNGGESLVGESVVPVNWTAKTDATIYRLYYSTTGAAPWTYMGSTGATTTFNWTVPNISSTSVRARIQAFNGSTWLGTDESNGLFSISVASIPGAVTSPNGTETLTIGSTVPTSWNAVPGATLYRLYYSATGAAPWTYITTSLTTDYNWTVPNVSTTTARFRVAAFNGGSWLGTDISDGDFTIQP